MNEGVAMVDGEGN